MYCKRLKNHFNRHLGKYWIQIVRLNRSLIVGSIFVLSLLKNCEKKAPAEKKKYFKGRYWFEVGENIFTGKERSFFLLWKKLNSQKSLKERVGKKKLLFGGDNSHFRQGTFRIELNSRETKRAIERLRQAVHYIYTVYTYSIIRTCNVCSGILQLICSAIDLPIM